MFPTNNFASTQQKPNKFPTNCQQTKQNKFIAKRFHCPNNLHKQIISLPKPNKFPAKDFYITKCISLKEFLHHKKWSTSIMVLDQPVSNKHHGTWSINPMPVATANYLWEWEHRKLGWIGLAQIPKVWLGQKARLNIFILHYVDQAYTIENESAKEK